MSEMEHKLAKYKKIADELRKDLDRNRDNVEKNNRDIEKSEQEAKDPHKNSLLMEAINRSSSPTYFPVYIKCPNCGIRANPINSKKWI